MATTDREDTPPDFTYKPRGGALGAATAFEKGTYGTTLVMYPEDLMAEEMNPYGKNYVVFYINVHSESALLKKEGVNTVKGAVPPRLAGDQDKLNLNGTAVTGVATVTAGTVAYKAGIGESITNVIKKATGVLGGTASEGAETVLEAAGAVGDAAIAGLAGAAVATSIGGVKGEVKRIDTAIALHMPTDLSIKYGVSWETTTAAAAATAAFIAGAEGLAGAIEDAVKAPFTDKTLGDAMASGGAGLRIGASAITGATLQIPGVGEVASKYSGIAANPKREQIFKQVDYRTFTFSYSFFPKTKEEAEKAKQIIYLFKLHMHPEYKQDSFNYLYLYPSEFDILYYHGSQENMNLHRHTSCVLTDMTVSYAPQGLFASFEDGTPVQINVQLTFKELATLSKETIEDGF